MMILASSSLSALSHSFWPGACCVHMVMSWLILSVTALWTQKISTYRQKDLQTKLFVSEGWRQMWSPSSSCQMVLKVGRTRVSGQCFGCQEQLAGWHGDGLQIGHHLSLVLFRLMERRRRRVRRQLKKMSFSEIFQFFLLASWSITTSLSGLKSIAYVAWWLCKNIALTITFYEWL